MRTALSLTLLLAAAAAQAKPLTVANDAWRNTALTELAPMLRACLPKAEQAAPARLPRTKEPTADLLTPVLLQEPATVGQGYWYRVGWRPSDGSVYIVGLRSPDGFRLVFGPVNESWTCLPVEVRKELGGR
jgi:hypothetical protein